MKNRLRGSEVKFSLINEVRTSAPPDILFPIAQWSTGWLSTLGIVAAIRPTSVSRLNVAPILEPIDIHAELTWLTARLAKSAGTLQKHVDQQVRLGEYILEDRVDAALGLIENAPRELGVSMTWTATTIGALQFFSGLEEQKEFVTTQREIGASRMLQFFAYWWSVRAEETTTSGHFISDIMRRLNSWDTSGTDSAQIHFYLLNNVPRDGHEAALLAVAASSAAIDAYEMVIALAEVGLAEDRPIANDLAPLLRRLAAVVCDNRLERILVLLGDAPPTGSVLVGPTLYQELEISQDANYDDDQPATTPMEFFAQCRIQKTLTDGRSTFFRSLERAVKSIGRNVERHLDSVETLNKVGLVFSALPLGRSISALASLNSTNIAPFNPAHETIAFINSRDSIFEAASCMPAELFREFIHKLDSRFCGNAVTQALHYFLGDISAENDLSILKQESALRVRLRAAVAQNIEDRVVEAASNLYSQTNCRVAVYAKFASQIAAGCQKEALVAATALLMDDPSFMHWLPAGSFLHSAYSDSENHFPDLMETSIFLDIYERQIDGAISSFTAYAAEDFVLAAGLDRPTELEHGLGSSEDAKTLYYLHRVCEPARLRFFSAFESEQELESERIDICLALSNMDPDRADQYEAEARSIVTGRLVKEGLRQLQASKISIDEAALRTWSVRNLREDFLRYQSLYSSGLVPIGKEYRQSLLNALESGTVPKDLFDVPQNEAISLFREMVTRFVQQCAFDTEHGLDCYLSLRIRHGTMSGELRSASEREHVVTRRSKEVGSYLSNQHWGDTFSLMLSPDDWDDIDSRLSAFSARLDGLISDLTSDYIQIWRTEKPNGLFNITLSPVQIYSVVVAIDNETTFDEFLDAAAEVFWATLQLKLEEVRRFIDTEYRQKIVKLFDNLEQDLRVDARLRPLADAVLRARNETDQAVDQVRDWFELPAATSSLAFGLAELVAVSMQTIQKFHPDFVPKLAVDSGDLPPFQSALNLFSDILFIVFENIYKHCGSNDPVVAVECAYEDRQLRVRISNSLSASIDFDKTTEIIETAKTQIQSDEFLSLVRREGGTGLPKLANLIGIRAGKGSLKFGADDQERIFWLEFGLESAILEREER